MNFITKKLSKIWTFNTLENKQLRQLCREIKQIKGLKVIEKREKKHIVFEEKIAVEDIEKLLNIFVKYKHSFHFYDALYPSPSDPGAYVSYEKVETENATQWRMSLGNHGWSGGIYLIDNQVFVTQLSNLLNKELLKEIGIEKTGWASHKAVVEGDRNDKENKKILDIHS
jgi:hypothetical protein